MEYQDAPGESVPVDSTGDAQDRFLRDLQGFMHSTVERLTNIENNQMRTPLTGESPASVPLATASSDSPAPFASQFARLCKQPDVFEGKRETTNSFLHQLRLYFAANTSLFPDDRRKVDYALMLLRGAAAEWSTPLVEQRSRAESTLNAATPRELLTWLEFEAAIRSHFGDLNERENAVEAILTLKQGGSRVTDFTTRFLTLRAKLPTYTEETCLDLYFRALKEAIQRNLLASWGIENNRPRTLTELARQAVQVEGLYFLHQQRNHRPIASYPSTKNSFAVARELPRGDPMQLDAIQPRRPRTRLTPREQDRRTRGNLCYNCGGSGHFARDCERNKVGPLQLKE